MNKLLGAIVAIAALALAHPALAADLRLPAKAPPVAVPPPLPFNWTGFYIGVNAGGSIGRNPTDLTSNGVTQEGSFITSPAGFAGGGQVGYNWQVAPTWVFGLEGDFQGTTQKDTASTGSIVESGSTLVTAQSLTGLRR